jgi:hypothetical protein
MEIIQYIVEVFRAILPFTKSPWFVAFISKVRFTRPTHGEHLLGNTFEVRGSYQRLLGMELVLFRVDGDYYWPTGPVAVDRTHKTWTGTVALGRIAGKKYSVVVAALTPLMRITVEYYHQVHDLVLHKHGIDDWFPIQIRQHETSSCLTELDRIDVTF